MNGVLQSCMELSQVHCSACSKNRFYSVMDSSSFSFASSMSGFAEDILHEIFLYLPLKSIFKFKCVSKVWSVLLSDPYFVNKWTKLNSSSLPWTMFYGFTPQENYLPDNPMKNWFSNAYPELHSPFFSCHNGFTFEFLNPESNCLNSVLMGKNKLYLLGSSNGLVLCWSTSLYKATSDYYVCNPLTQKWVALPPPPKPRTMSACSFECEFILSSHISTRYNVVRIPEFKGKSNKFNIEMFSSVSGEWSICEVLCPQVVTWKRNDHSDLLILHGVLYWIQGEKRILVCNMDSNQNIKTGGRQCRLIDLPDDRLCYSVQRGIWESEGLLCYASIADMFPRSTLSVWVLEEDEWHFLHKDINFDHVLTKMGTAIQDQDQDLFVFLLCSDIQILGFNPGDKNIVMVGYSNNVWAFNIRTKKLEELCRPSYLSSHRPSYDDMFSPAVLKTMPTIILPPPTWMDTSVAQ